MGTLANGAASATGIHHSSIPVFHYPLMLMVFEHK
jgi:hypothetical protein